MSNVNNIKDVQNLPIVTQKDLERAENKYNTEHFEEEIWGNAVDDTNLYINSVEIRLEGLETVVLGLEAKKILFNQDLEHVEEKGVELERTHDLISQKTEFMWTNEERKFMENYKNNKEVIEFEKNAIEFSLEEMDNIIEKKEKEVESNKRQKKLLEEHRDVNVKPRYEKEVKQAQKAYDEWQELKELAEAQKDIIKD